MISDFGPDDLEEHEDRTALTISNTKKRGNRDAFFEAPIALDDFFIIVGSFWKMTLDLSDEAYVMEIRPMAFTIEPSKKLGEPGLSVSPLQVRQRAHSLAL